MRLLEKMQYQKLISRVRPLGLLIGLLYHKTSRLKWTGELMETNYVEGEDSKAKDATDVNNFTCQRTVRAWTAAGMRHVAHLWQYMTCCFFGK